jgi:hypothetical protein
MHLYSEVAITKPLTDKKWVKLKVQSKKIQVIARFEDERLGRLNIWFGFQGWPKPIS